MIFASQSAASRSTSSSTFKPQGLPASLPQVTTRFIPAVIERTTDDTELHRIQPRWGDMSFLYLHPPKTSTRTVLNLNPSNQPTRIASHSPENLHKATTDPPCSPFYALPGGRSRRLRRVSRGSILGSRSVGKRSGEGSIGWDEVGEGGAAINLS
jgi:hypothetical protein